MWTTYTSMTNEWMKTSEVNAARPGNFSHATIREHLLALHSAGLIDRNGPTGRRWKKLDVSAEYLDHLAHEWGVKGKAQAIAGRHEEERQSYQESYPIKTGKPADHAQSSRVSPNSA
jgi:hypothetical protein